VRENGGRQEAADATGIELDRRQQARSKAKSSDHQRVGD
jgi:hypothetical protein